MRTLFEAPPAPEPVEQRWRRTTTPDARGVAWLTGGTVEPFRFEARAGAAAGPADAEQIRQAAKAEGHAQGLAAARGQVSEILQRYGNAAADLVGQHRLLAELSADRVTALAMTVARELVGHQLRVDPGMIAQAIDNALRELGPTRPVTVRVGRADAAYLRAHHPDLLQEGIELLEDPQLSVGSLTVEARHCVLDASFDAKLEVIAERIRAALAAEAPVSRPSLTVAPRRATEQSEAA
jgi:flagellar assembly protein FliH